MSTKCRARNPSTCRTHGAQSPIMTVASTESFEEFFTQSPTKKKVKRNKTVALPSISFPEIYHVGTLNIEDKQSESYEGQGLSFSLHPDEWQQITRLTGEKNTLKKDGNKFLNYHTLTKKQKQEITDYCVKENYVQETTTYRFSYWDDEMEEEMYFEFSNLEEAEEEAAGYEAESVTTHTSYKATDNFPDSTVKKGATGIHDIMTTVWVNETKPEYDGVWWADRLDISRLSAPRGVIVPNKIKEWLNS